MTEAMKTRDRESSEAARDMADAERTFSKSIAVSAIRCSLTYVLIPFVFPLVGWGAGAGPWIGLPIGIAAIDANGVSIRRFHRSNHKWKRHMTVVNVGIIGLLLVLIIIDAAELLG
ncbi:MAG: hypothetical protein HOJ56_12270 [Acidimicrobiaceae bacterium]|nr:hypothetical protein [Acidimicrobiaceae bacterium]